MEGVSVRVLHVDDDEPFLELTRTRLQGEGLTVVSESSPTAALGRLTSEPIDCVVSDYDMPELDGLEFLAAVREREQELPFILFTGKGSEEVASEAISAGVTDYLQKAGPEQFELLTNRIENAVEHERSQRVAERTRERFVRLIEGSTDLIFIVGEDGTYSYVSPSVERILGYDPDELVGTNGFDLVHPDDVDETMAQFERLVADSDEPIFAEFRARHADGSWRVLEVRGRNLLDDDVVEGIVVNARDVTDRRKREATLAALHDARETLMEPRSVDAIAETAVETACEVLDQPLSGVHLLRDDGLAPVAVAEDVERRFQSVHTYDDRDQVVWEVFTEGERRVFDDLRDADVELLRDSPIGSAILLPLGDHGVFIVCSMEPAAFDESDVDFANLLAGATRTALDRLEHESALTALHDVATDLEGCETVEAVVDRTVEAAENVLAFDLCVLSIEEDGLLRPTASSSDIHADETTTLSVDEGIMGKTFRTGEPILTEEVANEPAAEPQGPFESARSGISVPIGDHGVLQPVAERSGRFTEADLELAELLVSHTAEALDRIESAAELREERDRFAGLFESIPEPVVLATVVDGEPFVDDVNPAFEQVFGYDADQIVGEFLDDYIVPPERTEEADDLNEKVAAGDLAEREVRRLTADGEREFLFRFVPLSTTDSNQNIGVYVDITEQKRRIEELRRQNERLEEFASIVSHDLQNPLNVASGRLALAREGSDDDNLEVVDIALSRMEELVDALLELARQGRTVDDPETVPLDEAVGQAWTMAATESAELVVEDDFGSVQGDHERLCALFENLFRNAVEHGSAGSQTESGDAVELAGPDVTVTVGRTDEGFYVADDGPGIPPEQRDRIFEHGHSTADGNTGYGLSIVREIANAHGWTASATESESGGARFEFTGVE
jgi:PAS domain S-box-containing protein